MKKIFILILLFSLCCLVGCNVNSDKIKPNGDNHTINTTEPEEKEDEELIEPETEIVVNNDMKITCISGTKDIFSVKENVLTFTNIKEDTCYSIEGEYNGSILIDVSNDYNFELELNGFTIKSTTTNPISILSGNKVNLKVKKDTLNYIYDYREKITDENLYSAAIYSMVDLDISGKGKLEVYSQNNNGIHTKDDLEVKNLNLNVMCCDNALKGNDGVTIISSSVKLVAKTGDGIKTTNSHISDIGNQKGTVNIKDANVLIYASCDGIDAAYDVLIEEENSNVSIYTDKYSGYSDKETVVSESKYYIKTSNNSYKYAIKYYNSETNLYKWETATYHSGSNRNYYYTVNKPSGYDKLILYVYSSNQEINQEDNFINKFNMSVNDNYDTLYIRSSRGSCEWTNYNQPQPTGPGGGFGGMQEGNSDKGTYSTKGIKANNKIEIVAGNLTINSYDDALHANNTEQLENGSTPLGNVIISGGNLTIYSNDDGIHADNNLSISGGKIIINGSYEGIEGNTVNISGGEILIVSKDDGINATATTGTSITLSGGTVMIYASGDGIDSNSTQNYGGISFSGANVAVLSTSGGNSAIDSERGYSYTGGKILAIMPSGGMSSEATKCSNFTSIGSKKSSISLTKDEYVTVSVSAETVCVFKIPGTLNNALAIYLGSNSANIVTTASNSYPLLSNGTYFK